MGALEFQNIVPISLNILQTSFIQCYGDSSGSLSVQVSGGISPYLFNWSNGQTDSIASSLFAGDYSISVTDINGCDTISNVTITQPDTALSLSKSVTPVTSCFNNDGSAIITPNGGTSPYSYFWSTGDSIQNISDLGSGTYSVTVTDNNLCTISDTVYINNPFALSSPSICLVTVDSASTKNVIIWEKPLSEPIDSFIIYREIGLNNYVKIGSVDYQELSEFTDISFGINPNITSYRYKLSVLDTCGNESLLSIGHRTIHLPTPQFTPPNIFDLIWTNDYEGFNFSQYYILRDISSTGNWAVIDSVTYGSHSYTDINSDSTASYRLEISHPGGPCLVSKTAGNHISSLSNKTHSPSQPNGGFEIYSNMSCSFIPNPSTGKFTINSTNKITAIEIYNVFGEAVYKAHNLPLLPFEVIDISNQPSGVYFVQVKSGEIKCNQKLLKQ